MAFDHFRAAQTAVWPQVLGELRAGRKTTHWMWFVFPQLAALGQSATAKRFGLNSLADARAYAADPVLGMRLQAALAAATGSGEADPVALFGPTDAMKLRSCLTLFARAADDPTPFRAGLDHFFDGAEDPRTVALLQRPQR